MDQKHGERVYWSEPAEGVRWSGAYVLHLTSTRVIVEKLVGIGTVVLFLLLGLMIPGVLLLEWYGRRKARQRSKLQREPEQILASHGGNRAIAYDEMEKVILKRQVMRRGHGEVTIKSRDCRISLFFKSAHYDDILSLLSRSLVPEKIESEG